ncbi:MULTISPECIES: META domain-containing protein [unclassified Streptomyces]|uniref:META domain-containing protein n=1 Tax=unclassified Streptomyces TaxID=2593676 RepID=UPI002E10A089|nr:MULTISPECIES: META domain-containing protein [unclassified Streptomyces]WSQ78595.1 META domain-containing protein [Streptomyces sp. NBC_01213]WSQ85989.1 META domain-containing protein [Streptomyces sp. NBC_01212]WSR07935.1 META domain-containing protein [Streptomyces sp. NBC_01208]
MAMRTQRMSVSALAVLATFTLASCGTESGSGAGSGESGDGSGTVRTGPEVTGVHWNVSSLTVGGEKTSAPEGAHVEIDSEGKATGSLGCNRFTADARLDGDKVTVGQGTSTGMACAKEVQQFENAMGKAFHGELTAAVAGQGKAKTLTLTTAKGDSIALTSEPPAPLTGTAWKVTGLVSGSVASSLPAGTEDKAHLTFGEDGSVEGNLGCNSFHGRATVSGSTLTFGPLASTRKMCPEPEMKLERALLGVLEGKTSYEIDHRSLSIEAESGKGLDASAPAAED